MAEATPNVYQFKITLKGSKPPIWRRIQVPETYTFWELHVAITDAMGWLDCHLHEFKINNPETGARDSIGLPQGDGYSFDDMISGKTAKIAKYFVAPKVKAIYEYDFGDGWVHEIFLESILPAVPETEYPQCIAGRRACPPENSGGVEYYQETLEIIANPEHPEYAERMENITFANEGEEFHPEVFDPHSVVFGDPQESLNMREWFN